MTDQNNPWKTIDSRIIHQSPWLTLYEDNVIKPNGKPGTYTHVQSPPFVLIVGYDSERFIMIRQYRYPLKRVMTEFSGGSIDSNEEALDAAKREFMEETGLTAKRWTKLGVINNPNLATVYLAEGLAETGNSNMVEDGIADVVRLTGLDIDRMIQSGELTDSKTLAALFLFIRLHTVNRCVISGEMLGYKFSNGMPVFSETLRAHSSKRLNWLSRMSCSVS